MSDISHISPAMRDIPEETGIIATDILQKIEKRIDRMEEKLDRLIEQVLRELRAQME